MSQQWNPRCIGVAGMGLADPFIYSWILQALFGVKIIPGPPEADKIWQQGNTRHLFPLCNDPEAGVGGGDRGQLLLFVGSLVSLREGTRFSLRGQDLGSITKPGKSFSLCPPRDGGSRRVLGWEAERGEEEEEEGREGRERGRIC